MNTTHFLMVPYLAERAARATAGDLGRILAKAGRATPVPGDELPDGWPDRPAGMAPAASAA